MLLKQYKEGKTLSAADQDAMHTTSAMKKVDKNAEFNEMLSQARKHAESVMHESKKGQKIHHDEKNLSLTDKRKVLENSLTKQDRFVNMRNVD